jgi:hypothetical protein
MTQVYTASRPNTTAAVCDLAEAERFLKLLDPTATAFEFRTFDDNKSRKDENLTRTFYGTLAQYAAELKRLNNNGAGVFVTINETDGIGRKVENIERVRAVFIDLDGTPLEPVLQNRVKPHIIVETSPGKFHVYWSVTGMPLADFSSVQKAAIRRYNRDPDIFDLPRVMRLPGFYHCKREPFLIRIFSTHQSPAYPEAYFKRAPAEQHHTSRNKEPATELDLILAAGALEIIPTSLKWKSRNHIGMAAWRATDGHEEGFEAWSRWLERSGQFSAHRARKKWDQYFRSPPERIGLGTLIMIANYVDPKWRDKLTAKLIRDWVKP